jgi:hypothetical protein
MSWRFRKRVKIIPGIYLNFSKKGISTTIGPRGLSVNIGTKGTHLNAGIPGSGLSIRELFFNKKTVIPSPSKSHEIADKLKYLLEKTYDGMDQIKSESIEGLTSVGLQSLKESILAAHKEHAAIISLINELTKRKADKDRRLRRLRGNIFSFLYKKRISRYSMESNEMQEELNELNEQRQLATVDLFINNDDVFKGLYENIKKAYQVITSCQKTWDITASKEVNRVQKRSAAGIEVNRVEVRSSIASSDIIQLLELPLKLDNKNGGDLYFYPGFVIIHEQALDFAILDYSEFDIEFHFTRFIETDPIPSDSEIVGQTWAKVNKDGSPDKRFSNNYQIPIVKYGEMTFKSNTGMYEKYLFSNSHYANLFYTAMNDYIGAIKAANKLLEEFKA